MNKYLPLTVILVISLALGQLYLNSSSIDQFQQWKKLYGVQYKFQQNQQSYRRMIFIKNLQIINQHNNDHRQTYKMAINQFTIYSNDQFKARFLGEISQISNRKQQLQKQIKNQDYPNIEIDWTTKGGVSRVKNQGSCGSCWAFSAVGVSQSWALIFKKAAHDLSQQQLVDCSGSYGNHGCNGGSRQAALKYIKDHGLNTQAQYPYKGTNQACKKNQGSFKIPSVKQASGCTGIQNALQGRPIAVAVDAGGWSHYSTGVFSNCGTNINHAVLLVGVLNGNWKIKNSWGTSWGEKGFIRLASGNTCGVCKQPAVFIQ